LVTDVRLVAASCGRGGLVGWVGFVLGGIVQVDGVTLRETAAGALRLSFPERRDGRGRRHPIVRPLGDAARREIERQVFAALGITEVAP
jgi:DNA-binding cell septation regulator SpoVG